MNFWTSVQNEFVNINTQLCNSVALAWRHRWESLACMVIKVFTVAEISQRGILSEKKAKARIKIALVFKKEENELIKRTEKQSSGWWEENQKRVVSPWLREERNSCVRLRTQIDLKHMLWK